MTKKLVIKIFAALALLCCLAVAAARADEPAKEPAKDAEGYEKVDANMMQPGESIPANRLVAAAYGFIFASVAVYVGTVVSRSRRVEEEMDELKKKLEAKAK